MSPIHVAHWMLPAKLDPAEVERRVEAFVKELKEASGSPLIEAFLIAEFIDDVFQMLEDAYKSDLLGG
jgi:hypothetical protein